MANGVGELARDRSLKPFFRHAIRVNTFMENRSGCRGLWAGLLQREARIDADLAEDKEHTPHLSE